MKTIDQLKNMEDAEQIYRSSSREFIKAANTLAQTLQHKTILRREDAIRFAYKIKQSITSSPSE